MVCKVQSCKNYENQNGKDCILDFLDIIKLHYFYFKNESNEKLSNIFNMEKEILSLNSTINSLTKQIQSFDSIPVKRKKTNSLDPPDSTILSTSTIVPHAGLNINDDLNTTEDLNIALNSNSKFDDTSDVFNSPAKSVQKTSPTARLPLSPINDKEPIQKLTPVKDGKKKIQKETPVKLTPTKISQYLPKRIITKETPSGKIVHVGNENKLSKPGKSAATSSGWLSIDKRKRQNVASGASVNMGLKFIQPVQHDQKNNNLDSSSESIASSQSLIAKVSSRKNRNPLTLGANPKMRQPKLEFDRKISTTREITHIEDDNKPDDTFCDEVVGASPAVDVTSAAKSRNIFTQRSLRKFTRTNSDDELFNISIKKSLAASAPTQTENESTVQTSTPSVEDKGNARIKLEQTSTKKSCVTNLFQSNVLFKKDPRDPLITDDSISDLSLDLEASKVENAIDLKKNVLVQKPLHSNNCSSVLYVSQPDDVIVVDESENYNFDDIDSMDLLKEIMRKDSQTQMFLKSIEKEHFLIKKSQEKTNSTSILEQPYKSVNSKISQDEKNIPNIKSQFKELNEVEIKQKNTLFKENRLPKQELTDEKNESSNNKPQKENFITLQSVGHNCDCGHCNSYLRFLLSQKLSRSEIKIRLQNNNKHAQRPLKLHLTPEGFWDPRMTDFPPGDPRNEVIIDRRFVDRNNKDNKKSNDL